VSGLFLVFEVYILDIEKELLNYINSKSINKERDMTDKLISSGSIMLNLACSDTYKGAFKPGRMVNLIGDSSTGKTLIALSMFGDLHLNPQFDDYIFIYDDVEQALEFDLANLLGEECAERILPPNLDKDDPVYSDTIQDFNVYMNELLKQGKPFIYVLDSFDALTTVDELEYVNKEVKHFKEGKSASTLTGTYGADKPKAMSRMLRTLVTKLSATESFLLIISQTRDNIGSSFSIVGQSKTRSGGRALKFYASHEIWLAKLNNIVKTVDSIEYVVGTRIRAKVTKNKLTGKVRTADMYVYYDYGVDDVASCLDYLAATKCITKKKGIITIPEDNPNLQFLRDLGLKDFKSIVEAIDRKELWYDLFEACEKHWNSVEERLSLNRVNRFRRRGKKDTIEFTREDPNNTNKTKSSDNKKEK